MGRTITYHVYGTDDVTGVAIPAATAGAGEVPDEVQIAALLLCELLDSELTPERRLIAEAAVTRGVRFCHVLEPLFDTLALPGEDESPGETTFAGTSTIRTQDDDGAKLSVAFTWHLKPGATEDWSIDIIEDFSIPVAVAA